MREKEFNSKFQTCRNGLHPPFPKTRKRGRTFRERSKRRKSQRKRSVESEVRYADRGKGPPS